MGDDTDSSYVAYAARKAKKLRLTTLDCGHPNDGDVYGHLWCNRTACRECADLDHGCSAYGGVESSIEEEAVEPEAVDEGPGLFAEMMARQPRCRGCREWVQSPGGLCETCRTLPTCGGERTNGLDGRHMSCIRPFGHLPPCEEQAGSQWYAIEEPLIHVQEADNLLFAYIRSVSEVESGGHISVADPSTPVDGFTRIATEDDAEALRPAQLRPFLTTALDSEEPVLAARISAALDELVEPDPARLDVDDIATSQDRPRWLRWLPGGRS